MKVKLPQSTKYDEFEWHDIFAWLPTVTINNELVWLQPLQRRWTMYSSTDLSATREYRIPSEDAKRPNTLTEEV